MTPLAAFVISLLLSAASLNAVHGSPLPATLNIPLPLSATDSSITDQQLENFLSQSISNTTVNNTTIPSVTPPNVQFQCNPYESPYIDWQNCILVLVLFNQQPKAIVPARWGLPGTHFGGEGYLPFVAHGDVGNNLCAIKYEKLPTTQVGRPWSLFDHSDIVNILIQYCTLRGNHNGGRAIIGPPDNRRIMVTIEKYPDPGRGVQDNSTDRVETT